MEKIAHTGIGYRVITRCYARTIIRVSNGNHDIGELSKDDYSDIWRFCTLDGNLYGEAGSKIEAVAMLNGYHSGVTARNS